VNVFPAITRLSIGMKILSGMFIRGFEVRVPGTDYPPPTKLTIST
jgi:hypothetical protein